MERIRVLVTGAGSGVGQGILKALRISSLPITTIAADIDRFQPGLFRADEAVLIPRVESADALETIIDRIRVAKARVVMIGSEFDLIFFARHKTEIEQATGALVVVSPLETVLIADDKLRTAGFLREHNLPHAMTRLPGSVDEALAIAEEWGYPILVKPRSGTSGRGLHLIDNSSEMKWWYPRVQGALVQALIRTPSRTLDREYTCSIFKDSAGTLIGPFTARRTLRGGHSWVVEVAPFENLFPLMRTLGEKLEIMGSLNVQLMIGDEGPVPFEFNARFSGTTAVRAHFGFNEPEMTLRSYVLGQPIETPRHGAGIAFRYTEEVFVDGASAETLAPGTDRGFVPQWF